LNPLTAIPPQIRTSAAAETDGSPWSTQTANLRSKTNSTTTDNRNLNAASNLERELATKTELFPFDFSKNRTEAPAQEPGIKNESAQIGVRSRGFATADPKILTPANLRNFTRRDEPGQIPRTKKTPIFHPQKPRQEQACRCYSAARGPSSDVGRRRFAKSTVIQQTEGLGCG